MFISLPSSFLIFSLLRYLEESETSAGANFNSVLDSWLTLYEILVGDGAVMKAGIQALNGWVAVYFMSFTILLTLLFANLVIGIFVNAMRKVTDPQVGDDDGGALVGGSGGDGSRVEDGSGGAAGKRTTSAAGGAGGGGGVGGNSNNRGSSSNNDRDRHVHERTAMDMKRMLTESGHSGKHFVSLSHPEGRHEAVVIRIRKITCNTRSSVYGNISKRKSATTHTHGSSETKESGGTRTRNRRNTGSNASYVYSDAVDAASSALRSFRATPSIDSLDAQQEQRTLTPGDQRLLEAGSKEVVELAALLEEKVSKLEKQRAGTAQRLGSCEQDNPFFQLGQPTVTAAPRGIKEGTSIRKEKEKKKKKKKKTGIKAGKEADKEADKESTAVTNPLQSVTSQEAFEL